MGGWWSRSTTKHSLWGFRFNPWSLGNVLSDLFFRLVFLSFFSWHFVTGFDSSSLSLITWHKPTQMLYHTSIWTCVSFIQWRHVNFVVPPPLPPPCLVTYLHKGVVSFWFCPSSLSIFSSSSSSPWYVPLPISYSSSLLPPNLLPTTIIMRRVGTKNKSHMPIMLLDSIWESLLACNRMMEKKKLERVGKKHTYKI